MYLGITIAWIYFKGQVCKFWEYFFAGIDHNMYWYVLVTWLYESFFVDFVVLKLALYIYMESAIFVLRTDLVAFCFFYLNFAARVFPACWEGEGEIWESINFPTHWTFNASLIWTANSYSCYKITSCLHTFNS